MKKPGRRVWGYIVDGPNGLDWFVTADEERAKELSAMFRDRGEEPLLPLRLVGRSERARKAVRTKLKASGGGQP